MPEKTFEKYMRETKEKFVRLVKSNKIQWNLTDKETVIIEDLIIAYDQMYCKISSEKK